MREEEEGEGPTREQLVADFAAVSRTQPDKAGKIIHRGVEAGKARILAGLDAHLFDILTRLTPTHYMDVMNRFQAPINRARRAGTVPASDG